MKYISPSMKNLGLSEHFPSAATVSCCGPSVAEHQLPTRPPPPACIIADFGTHIAFLNASLTQLLTHSPPHS